VCRIFHIFYNFNNNPQEIDRVKDELGEIVRQRVQKAIESFKDTLASSPGKETTAGGSKPVVCIACSRPVRIETETRGLILL